MPHSSVLWLSTGPSTYPIKAWGRKGDAEVGKVGPLPAVSKNSQPRPPGLHAVAAQHLCISQLSPRRGLQNLQSPKHNGFQAPVFLAHWLESVGQPRWPCFSLGVRSRSSLHVSHSGTSCYPGSAPSWLKAGAQEAQRTQQAPVKPPLASCPLECSKDQSKTHGQIRHPRGREIHSAFFCGKSHAESMGV